LNNITPKPKSNSHGVGLYVFIMTMAGIFALIGLLSLVIAIGVATDVHLGQSNDLGQTKFNLGIIVITALHSLCLFGVVVAIGAEDQAHGKEIDPLYAPIVWQAGAISMVLSISGLRAVDLLIHSGQPRWVWLYDPVVSSFISFSFACVVLAFDWKVFVILTGHKWKKLSVFLFLGGITVAAGLILLALMPL
jgi:hypothetical protein